MILLNITTKPIRASKFSSNNPLETIVPKFSQSSLVFKNFNTCLGIAHKSLVPLRTSCPLDHKYYSPNFLLLLMDSSQHFNHFAAVATLAEDDEEEHKTAWDDYAPNLSNKAFAQSGDGWKEDEELLEVEDEQSNGGKEKTSASSK
jgi:hypothetical protein